jgi:hypothetical protein
MVSFCGTRGSDLMEEWRGIERMDGKKQEKWEAEEEVFKFDRSLAMLHWRVSAYLLASSNV